MRDILKRFLIGVAIGMALFFLKSNVFAATTLQASRYTTTYLDASCHNTEVLGQIITTCVPSSGTPTTSSYTPFGTGISGPKYILSNTVNFMTYSDSSKNFISGQQCQIKFTVNWNPRNSQAQSAALEGVPSFQYFDGSNYVNFSDASLERSLSSDNYGINYYYNFTVPQNTRFMQVTLNYPSSGNTGVLRNSSSQGLNIKNASLNCVTNTTDIAIQDAANQISGSVNGAGSQAHVDAQSMLAAIQNIGSQFTGTGTSPNGTVSRNNVYSNSGLAQKEGQINWQVDDDVFDLDLQPFSSPISFIWLQVTTFINLDPLFLSLIIACLIVSFICLVVGRS